MTETASSAPPGTDRRDKSRGSGAFFNWMFAVFTAPFTAAGIYGFLRHWVDFGIGPVASEFYTFYSTVIVDLVAFPLSWLLGWIGWSLPESYKLYLPLSLIGAAAVVRGTMLNVIARREWTLRDTLIGILVVIVAGFTMFGFTMGLIALGFLPFVILERIDDRFGREDPDSPWYPACISLLLAIGALFLAFAENWFLAGGAG